MDEKGLGKRLQQARLSAGLTQQDLCHKANLSYSTLTKIERGAIKAPSIFTIQSIAKSVGMGLDELLGNQVPRRQVSGGKTSPSGVKFIYFDMNGVLVRFYSSALTQLARDSDNSVETIESIYMQNDNKACRGELSLNDLNAIWSERTGIPVDWKQYYLNAVDTVPNIDELLVATARDYPVGILSNTLPGFITALRAEHKLPAINYAAIVDSSEVELLKPEPKMYEIAAQKAGYEPSEILLVDDTRSNLVAADAAGWHTIWFDSYQPENSIQTIKEALEI